MANQDLERVRKIIEADMHDMINDDMYIIPPQYDDTAPTSASQLSHGKKTTSTKVAIAIAMAKQRIKSLQKSIE